MAGSDFHVRFLWLPLLGFWAGLGNLAASAAGPPSPWYLQPLVRPPVPTAFTASTEGTPIDAFVARELQHQDLSPSPPASRPALLRRLCFDLTGLPPTPEEVQAFVKDADTDACERVVDRLLSAPQHGERWARHWMDVVHFAETHGHDEDAIREHAWPYRDYLIQSFNSDKPYVRFVQEQIAGDVLFPGDPQAVVATAFLAAGPWDASSQMGIQDDTIDKKIAQYLDRDDMIDTTMSTFVSLTVACARCHDHKFDPIPQEDYYALQAVFAGVDRVDRSYDADPETHRRRQALLAQKACWDSASLSAAEVEKVERRSDFRTWERHLTRRDGHWKVLVADAVLADASEPPGREPDQSLLYGGARPDKDTYVIRGTTDLARVTGVRVEVLADERLPQKGPGRQDNGNLHLTEFAVRAAAAGQDEGWHALRLDRATADFNQEGWTIAMAIDGDPKTAWGIHPQVGQSHHAVFGIAEPETRDGGMRLECRLEQWHGGGHLIGRLRLSVTDVEAPEATSPLPAEIAAAVTTPPEQRSEAERSRLVRHYLREQNRRDLEALPPPATVYAVASEFSPQGNFKPSHHPREVHLLNRGDIHRPGPEAVPGALQCVAGAPARFAIEDTAPEGERRAALARWLTHPDNGLLWRSMANRVWHYHFGRGLVATPNDFGAMGAQPSHPELLDWLACELRDSGGSLKHLHKQIVMSRTYRQSSADRTEALQKDADNRWLWRMNLRRLDAESIRDAMLQVSGRLDPAMGGPSARQFLLSKGVHVTPVLDYEGFDPDDPANLRRSIYRFIFRTVPDPFMHALGCADASQLTPRRSESFTATQALAMMHHRTVLRLSEHCAVRLQREADSLPGQVQRMFLLAYGRPAEPDEVTHVAGYAAAHGLANACRMIFNSNEFVFVP